jgi:hypothetical protein
LAISEDRDELLEPELLFARPQILAGVGYEVSLSDLGICFLVGHDEAGSRNSLDPVLR